MYMQMIDEIIKASCGKNEDNNPNCSFTLCTQKWSIMEEDKEPETIGEHPAYKPVLDMQKHGKFIQIDLEYPTSSDIDLKIMWNMLEKYGQELDEVNEDSESIPMSALTIVPLVYEGCYYMIAINPIFWTLQPSQPGKEATVIRLLYEEENLNFYEASEEDIDIEGIEADVDRAILEQQNFEQEVMDKERERAEYEEKRNAAYEEMRRNGEL